MRILSRPSGVSIMITIGDINWLRIVSLHCGVINMKVEEGCEHEEREREECEHADRLGRTKVCMS